MSNKLNAHEALLAQEIDKGFINKCAEYKLDQKTTKLLMQLATSALKRGK